MHDPDTRAAVDALARRLRDRDPGTDDEVLARELVVMLQGRGWRPTEAKPPPPLEPAPPRPGPGHLPRGPGRRPPPAGGIMTIRIAAAFAFSVAVALIVLLAIHNAATWSS